MPAGRWDELLRSGRLLVLWCRRCLLATTVAVAWVGALTAPAHLTLVVAPVCGGLALAGLLLGAAGAGLRRPSRRAQALTAMGGLLLVPFTAGASLLGPVGAALSLGLLVTAAARLPADPWAASSPADVTLDEVAGLGAGLHRLPSAALLEHWQRTADVVSPGAGPELRAAVSELRSRLLDELSRRDPAGVERWLRSGGDPARHLATGEAGPTA